MVTFTLPQPLRAWVRSHPKLSYRLLFAATARALQDLARNPKRLGAHLGMLAVLHTWSPTLIFHPHIHYLVPGGGLSLDQRQWLSKGRPLADHFRTLFKKALARKAPELLDPLPTVLWSQRWVVKVNAVGSGHHALAYLSRYVFETATANRRVLELTDGRLRWPYRNSRTRQWDHVNLTPEELIRRFLQHILPPHFHRVRLVGWLHPSGRTKLNRVRALLRQSPHLTSAEQEAWQPSQELFEPADPVETPEPLAPLSPQCRQPMTLVARWNAGQTIPLPFQRGPP